MRSFLLAAVAALLAAPALAVAPAMKLYQDDFALVAFERLTTNRSFQNAPLSELTTSGASSAPALEALATWDFTPAAARANGYFSFGQVVPASSAWTCYLPDTIGCGFGSPNVSLLAVGDGRNDQGQASRSVAAYEFDSANGRVLGRALVFDEGLSSEIRLCLPPGPGQPDFPVAVFPHVEGGTQRRYMQALDEWSSDVFDCIPAATQGAPCHSAGGTNANLDANPPTTEGRQRFRVVKAGTVTLPSGHVLDALLIESFTSYSGRLGCPGLVVLNLRQWRLTWAVPEYGPILSLTSTPDTATLAGFATAEGASLGVGLLPPISIQATGATTSSVTVSWDPGTLVSSIADGWIVHWGPASGTAGAPPFSSHPIPVGTTSYTINGLAPGQTVYVSVTSRRAYLDPKSSVSTVYESIGLPQRIGADLDGDGDLDTAYPPEVAATALQAGGCVKGDVAPAEGDGRVSLSDYLTGRAKLTGRAEITARDTTCGDAAPGTVICAPVGSASHWCASGNGAFTLSDLLVIRRLATGAFANSCATCQVFGGALSGEELRMPGDIAPRGNADGALNIGDVVVALRMTVALETPTAEELLRADVAPTRVGAGGVTEAVGNGSVTIGDVVTMLRASVQLENLRWPRRLVRAHVDDSVDFVGFKLTVGAWPTWAVAEPAGVSQVPCDDSTVDVVGDQWVALCDTSPATVQAPTDLFDFAYRSPAIVPASSLVVVPGVTATTVSRPGTFDDFEPSVTLSNFEP